MKLSLLIFSLLLSGCQLPYYLKSGYHQALLIKNQESVSEVLSKNSLGHEQKRKIQLISQVKLFSEQELGLKNSKNYTSFVELDRPFVTYIVQVAYPNQLKYRMWKFPIVGQLPYKGFFNLEDAKKEANSAEQEGFDVSIRGVRAYSTLGWLKDPILSSMLQYDDEDLINLIIHELTHTTLFIKNSSDFNEQLATFVGNKGTELFIKANGNLDLLDIIQQKNHDEILFSKFIDREFLSMESWYKKKPHPTKEEKQSQFREIQKRFKDIRFNTDRYTFFLERDLNNASFLGLKTYLQDLSLFENIWNKTKNMKVFLKQMALLEQSKSPKESLEKLNHSP